MATSTAVKNAAAKADAVKAADAEKAASKPKGEGRTNQVAAFTQAAEANGWKVTTIKVDDLPEGAHKYARSVGGTENGAIKATKGDTSILVATFTGRSGQKGRMSAGYIVKDGNTRNLGVVYQIMSTLESGEAATKDDSRKRGPKADKAEDSTEATPEKAAPAKKAAAAKKAPASKAEVTPIPKKATASKKSA